MISNAVISQLRIYADNTNIFSGHSSKSEKADTVYLTTAFEKDLRSVVNWGKK